MSLFHSKPADTVPTPQPDVAPPVELVALSVLQLDLSTPGEGWNSHLSARGIEITLDDIGRASVARGDARRLFTERREVEAQAREHAAAVERAAVEADELRRAQLYKGIPAYAIPDGVAPAAAMMQAAHDARPRRQGVLQAALAGESMTFHPIRATGEES